MFPSMKCTQTFVNGPLMSVLSKDGGLTFVHVTQRTVIPISLQTHYCHLVFAFQETLISSLVFPKFERTAINVFLAVVIALICVSELTLVRSPSTSMFSATRGQFYKSFTLVIYKCSYCFQLGKQ